MRENYYWLTCKQGGWKISTTFPFIILIAMRAMAHDFGFGVRKSTNRLIFYECLSPGSDRMAGRTMLVITE